MLFSWVQALVEAISQQRGPKTGFPVTWPGRRILLLSCRALSRPSCSLPSLDPPSHAPLAPVAIVTFAADRGEAHRGGDQERLHGPPRGEVPPECPGECFDSLVCSGSNALKASSSCLWYITASFRIVSCRSVTGLTGQDGESAEATSAQRISASHPLR